MYARILYPDRAEDMRQNPRLRQGYRVFLDHWPNFIKFLKQSYERVVARQASFALSIYGPQGVGKTLLADKLRTDFNSTKESVQHGSFDYDPNNLWHILSSGYGKDIDSIKRSTENTEFIEASDLSNWVETVSNWSSSHPSRAKIVILDNAERAYFGAGLAGLDEAEFISKRKDESLTIHIAQQFIRLARSSIRGTLFIILGNDEEFLSTFYETCESQHRGMVSFQHLPLPSPKDKETIVRINVNRLNKVSYWSCVDKSGPEKKRELYETLKSVATFPDTFYAVDEAFSEAQARQGRPANKCILSLVLLSRDISSSSTIAKHLSGEQSITPILKHEVSEIYVINKNYCQIVMPNNIDQAAMLESEFTLRFITLSNKWIKQFLGDVFSQTLAIDCLYSLLKHPRIGHSQDLYYEEQINFCDQIEQSLMGADQTQIDNFWTIGSRRSVIYEKILKSYFRGYNRSFCKGFPKRPDILLEPYTPCAMLSASNNNATEINEAISRRCHSVEVTAQMHATPESVVNYLSGKLPNYIQLVQEL